MKHSFFYIPLLSLLSVFCYACDKDDSNPSNDDNRIDKTLNCRSPQEAGPYETFYKPRPGWAGDPMPFYDEDSKTFHLFYLQDFRNGSPLDHPIFVIKTKDYGTFNGFAEAIPCGLNEQAQDAYLGTGSFIKKDGIYYGFYTGHNERLSPVEKVMLATSSDMKKFTKVPSFTFEAPNGYDKDNFRDPFVYFDETRNCYVMLVATRLNNQGVLARYTSSDLMQWTLIDPLTDFESDASMLECPDMFKMGDKWYLIFSRINRDQHRKTYYRVADSPNGPWKICRDANGYHETFDGLYLYAGKTASDGNNRYLTGWCSTGQEVNYKNELDWAGSLISHKLVQQPSGRLYPVIADAVDNKFTQAIEFAELKKAGNVTGSDGNYTINESGYVVFNRNKKPVKITMTIDASQATQSFGIAFGACDNQEDTYDLSFDLSNKNQWGLPAVFMYHNWIESEVQQQEELNFTPLIVPENKVFNITILMEKSVCCMYINNNIAFSNRIYTMNQNPWMIFADGGTVKFSNIKVYK